MSLISIFHLRLRLRLYIALGVAVEFIPISVGNFKFSAAAVQLSTSSSINRDNGNTSEENYVENPNGVSEDPTHGLPQSENHNSTASDENRRTLSDENGDENRTLSARNEVVSEGNTNATSSSPTATDSTLTLAFFDAGRVRNLPNTIPRFRPVPELRTGSNQQFNNHEFNMTNLIPVTGLQPNTRCSLVPQAKKVRPIPASIPVRVRGTHPQVHSLRYGHNYGNHPQVQASHLSVTPSTSSTPRVSVAQSRNHHPRVHAPSFCAAQSRLHLPSSPGDVAQNRNQTTTPQNRNQTTTQTAQNRNQTTIIYYNRSLGRGRRFGEKKSRNLGQMT